MASATYQHLRNQGQRRRAGTSPCRIGWVVLLLLAAPAAWAQRGGQPTARKAPATPAASAAPQPLAPQKVEEALRLLLRADSLQTQRQRALAGPESSGLVVDQTITKIGHDFYDQFYSGWEALVESGDFIIVISERPARGNSALVTLTVNEELLLELPLQPKYDLIAETAEQAVEVAASFLQQARNLSQQLERGNKQALETY